MTIRLSAICFIVLLHVCSLGMLESFLHVVNGLDRTVKGNVPESFHSRRRTLERVKPSTQSTNKRSVQHVEQYNLIWSRGAWKKAMISLSTLLVCHIASHRVNDSHYLFVSNAGQLQLPKILNTFLVPLMASSCCALQLALNLFSFGCAGFNKVLGPSRPFFLGLLAYLSLLSTDAVLTPVWIRSFVLRWSLALLPEIIQLWNGRKTTVFGRKSTDRSNARNDGVGAVISISIPTMGCVACINKIDNSLRKLQGVDHVSSKLSIVGPKGGSTEVTVTAESESDFASIKNSLVEAIESAGFSQSVILSTEFRR